MLLGEEKLCDPGTVCSGALVGQGLAGCDSVSATCVCPRGYTLRNDYCVGRKTILPHMNHFISLPPMQMLTPLHYLHCGQNLALQKSKLLFTIFFTGVSVKNRLYEAFLDMEKD